MRTLLKLVWFRRRWQKPRKKHKMRGLKTVPKDYRKIFTVKMFDVLFARRCETQRQKLPGGKAIVYFLNVSLLHPFALFLPLFFFSSYLHMFTYANTFWRLYGIRLRNLNIVNIVYSQSTSFLLTHILYTGEHRTWIK